ncbi:MAG: hypothetical protein HOM52_03220, partial [Rhodospirillaceae bacterium]|nr:hypothetical protein [Rhodospirillaceae bacterium]
IGRVDETVGDVTATRVDGTTVTLGKDSSVFQGDILETGSPAPAFSGNTTVGSGSAGIFNSVSLGSSGFNTFNVASGIVLTTGDGTPNGSNTQNLASATASGTGDSDLDALLSSTSHGTTTTDSTVLSFTFTVPAGVNAIIFDYMYGTEEFNTENETDVAAVFVDGTNFAFLADNSILHFDIGANESNFFNNNGSSLGVEYDGMTPDDVIVGLLSGGATHTLKVAIADTVDSAGDSALFLSAFALGKSFSFTSAGNDVLAGTTGDDSVDGGTGSDAIFGAAGNDTLNGNDDNDEIHGGAGNDLINGGSGLNELNGGAGTDTVLYSDATSAVAVSLAIQAGTGGGRADVVKFFENVTGSNFNDAISGDSGTNIISGGSGDDTLAGAGGNDTIQGGSGNDVLSGGTGNDEIIGGTGNDNMSGGAGTNKFSFNSLSDGENNATNTTDTIGSGFHNLILDFTSGTDTFTLNDDNFSLGTLVAGTNFFSIGSQFDGTNTSAGGSTPYIVVDSTKTVYFDHNGAVGLGYTVMAENSTDAPVLADFELVTGGL